ncbi:hypothetical protein NQZ68_039071 [Dissostichus eleginoides]|nr:hypothetical protein NQZ68_039071 [Dissostichus eleginoides]
MMSRQDEGELAPYKRRSNSAEDTINWNHLQHRQSSSPTVFYSRRTSTICKMKLIILCLCLASASAAPSIFHYLPHYAGSRPQVAPSQVRNPFGIPSLPLPGGAGAYSVELIYPHSFAGGAGGSNPAQPFASHGFMKISIPQPPGRQSVEVYYPYDFSQQRIMTNIPPMTNAPQMPHGLPFDFPPQNIPQQIPNIPTFDTGFNALPSQDPLQTLQQDQPTQTNKELLPFHGPEEQDKVCEEFLEYQLMDIPMPQDPTTFNVEEFWGNKTTVPTQSPAAAKISL